MSKKIVINAAGSEHDGAFEIYVDGELKVRKQVTEVGDYAADSCGQAVVLATKMLLAAGKDDLPNAEIIFTPNAGGRENAGRIKVLVGKFGCRIFQTEKWVGKNSSLQALARDGLKSGVTQIKSWAGSGYGPEAKIVSEVDDLLGEGKTDVLDIITRFYCPKSVDLEIWQKTVALKYLVEVLNQEQIAENSWAIINLISNFEEKGEKTKAALQKAGKILVDRFGLEKLEADFNAKVVDVWKERAPAIWEKFKKAVG